MRLILPVAAIMLMPTALLAQDRPPADALPLSQILSTLEEDVGTDLAFVDEVDWDDDGYYEVEYYTGDGREVKVRLDPVTGQPR